MECNFENCPNFERLGKKFADKISELEQENDRLKEEIKEAKKYQYQQEYLDKEIAELKAYKDVNEDFKTAWEELKAENERLKEEILKWQKAYSRQYQINENKGYNKKEEQYRQTLQEIKAIADEDCEFCDDIGGCMDNECRIVRILDLITKAEEE